MALSVVVREALNEAKPSERDAATAELALTYAGLMDDAAPAGKYAKALEWLAGQGSEDLDADKHIRLIGQALAAHSVASDLGPKLLAALEALQMSPRARAVVQKGGTGDKPSNALDQLAERRRARSAPPVDAAAP